MSASLKCALSFAISGLIGWSLGAQTPPSTPKDAKLPAAPAMRNIARLPLAFEKQGKGFVARGQGYAVGVDSTRASIVVSGKDKEGGSVSLNFVGAGNSQPVVGPELPGKVNYIRGNDPSKWQTGLKTYARVTYPNVWPGIDLAYYGNQQRLEFDFVVRPGAKTDAIRFKLQGASKLSLDGSGALRIGETDDLRIELPKIYQEIEGIEKRVAGRYSIRGDEVSFRVDPYDDSKPLVIDPAITYSALLGGGLSSSYAYAIALDTSGNVLIAGYTYAADFPLVNAAQSTFNTTCSVGFVTKINPAGTELLYSTFLGGSNCDYLEGLAVDSSGSAWVTGFTGSSNFPVLNAAQSVYGGNTDVVVAKLSAEGVLQFSTYLGGNSYDSGAGIAVDSAGNGYVTGYTDGSFPATAAMPQPANECCHAFLTKYGPAGTLVYSAILGGNSSDGGKAVAVDASGDAWVTGYSYSSTFTGAPTTAGAQPVNNGGEDAFIAEVNPTATEMLYFTFLGGTGYDWGNAIALDSSGNVYIAGQTNSTGLATIGAAQTAEGGAYDGFAAKLSVSGNAFTYITYLGGSRNEYLTGMALDKSGNVYLAGYTDSANFPTQAPVQASLPGNEVSLYSSTNSGGTWSASDTNIPGAVFNLSINPSGASEVVITESGIYRTANGGATWTQQFNSSFYSSADLSRSPASPGTIYVIQCCSSIYQSTDDGVTWNYMGYTNFNGYPNGILADPLTADTVYAYGYSSPYVWVSTNGGATWSGAGTGLPNSQVESMVATSDGSLYVATNTGGIYKSSNQAGSWTAVNSGLPSLYIYYPQALSASGTTVYLTDGNLYETTNGGSSWSQLTGFTSGNAASVVVSPQSASTLYVWTYAGTIEESTNGGTTWSTAADTGLPPTTYYYNSTLYIDPSNSSHVLLVAPVNEAAFVAKLNSTGSALTWSTYLGGTDYTYAYGIAASGAGSAYVTGYTGGGAFPVTSTALPAGTNGDTFITEISDATPACSLTVTPAGTVIATSYSQSLSFSVVAPSGCAWTASTNASWASISGSASGTGSGTITVQISQNNGATQSAVLTVGSHSVTITQAGSSCSYSLNQYTYVVPQAGGPISAALTATSGCPWSVTSPSPAVSFTTASSGTGSATIGMTVAPNPSPNPQTFYLSLGNTSFYIEQGGTPPSITSVTPNSVAAYSDATPITIAGSNFGSGTTVVFTPPGGGIFSSTSITPTQIQSTQITATIPANLLTAAGTAEIAVQYVGSVSNQLAFTITAATSSTTTLTVSPASPAAFGQSATLTATVSPSTATGSVTFYDDVTVLGSGVLSAGQATLTTTLLPAGANSLRAYYVGAPGISASGSASIPFVVGATPASSNTYSVLTGPTAGTSPESVAVSDFNGDHKADLVVANEGGNNVSIFLSNGDGTFQSAVNYAVGSGPISVAVGDFNGDGKVDLAVANSSGNNASILLGNGDGTFQAAVNYAVGNNPYSIAIGDFNLDGKPDLVVSNYFGANVSVLLGNGDGTFQTAQNFNAGSYPYSVAVADFNGDGRPDLVAANTTYPGDVSVLLGNGDGTFQSAVSYAVGNDPEGVAVGDFNGDGKPDLAVPNDGSNTVSVLLGNGDGTFQTAVNYASGGFYPASILAADVSGDGRTDLVIGNQSSIAVLHGNGNGTFTEGAVANINCCFNSSIAAGDFTGSGRIDLAVTEPYEGSLELLFGAEGSATTTTLVPSQNPSVYSEVLSLTAIVSPPTATGTVVFSSGSNVLCSTTISNSGVGSCEPSTLAAGSYPIVANYGGNANDGPSASAVLNEVVNVATPTVSLSSSDNPWYAGGGLALVASITPSSATGTVTFMDGSTTLGTATLNGGSAFLSVSTLSAGSHSLTAIYSGDANDSPGVSPTLTENVIQPSASTTTLVASSVNPSTLSQSVTLAAAVTPSAATGNVTFYDGTSVLGIAPVSGGQASFTTKLLPFGTNAIKAYFAFSAADGSSVSAPLPQMVSALPANGFAAAVNYSTAPYPQSVATADFNGDGKPDLVLVANGGISVLLGNGNGTFQTAVNNSGKGGTIAAAVADFNGDGKPDIATANGLSNTVSIWLGNGDGTFQTPVSYALSTSSGYVYAQSIAVSDFNGDGKADVVVAAESGGVTVLLGNGDGTLGQSIGAMGSIYATSVAVGDFNGDGKPDIAATESCCGIEISLGNGDGTFQAPVNFSTAFSNLYAVSVGDFNGDGKADLAAASYEGVDVLLGNGDGTFQTVVAYATLTASPALAIGDVNGDGKADLITADDASNATVLLGNGDGTFQTPVNYSAGSQPYAVAVGDFNLDGRTDLAVANFNSGNVSILLGAGAALQTQTIAFGSLSNVTYGVSPFTVSATASSGLTVSFGSSTPAICTVSGTTVTIVGAGSCTITASQGGNGTYAAAAGVSRSFTVNSQSQSQTIDFGPLTTETLQSTVPPLSATASSGLGVTFSSNSASVCTVSGVNITLVAVGTCSITASQPGNSAYAAAASVTQTFTVAPGPNAVAVLRDTYGAIRLSTYAASTLVDAGGSFAGDPAVAQDRYGNTFVAARDNYNGMWANVYSGVTQSWDTWQFGGGVTQGVPSLAVDTAGTGWIAARDAYNSYWLLNYSSGSGFGTWLHLAGVFATDPVVTACGDGSIYVIGKDNYNALWTEHYIPGTGAQGWVLQGGVVSGKPSATCGGDNAVYIAVEDDYNANWVARVSGNGSAIWHLGGGVTSVTPRIAALGNGSEAVVILDGTGSVWTNTYTEGTGNGWGTWSHVGGVLQDVAPAAAGGQLYFIGNAGSGGLWWWNQTAGWTWIGNGGVTAGALAAAPN